MRWSHRGEAGLGHSSEQEAPPVAPEPSPHNGLSAPVYSVESERSEPTAPVPQPTENRTWSEFDGHLTSEPDCGLALPATFSGRLHVVFTPCPDAERLGLFWEVLDGLAGAGGIVDAHPTDSGAGFEFVLDLDSRVLVVEDLKRQIPHSQIMSPSSDRLDVNWSSD